MDDNETFSPTETVKGNWSIDYARKKRCILMWLLGYAAAFGVVCCFFTEESKLVDFIVGLPGLLLGLSWCFTDAAERNHRIGGLMKVLLVFFFLVAFPIYLLQTRGFRGFKSLGLALLFIATMLACTVATMLASLYLCDVFGLTVLEY